MADQTNKSKAAGGVPAIIATVKTLSDEMGLVRGVRTMLKVNQSGGVDCPGCAWPEPDSGRSHFEFCENGAKHIADEATTKRVTPEFFPVLRVAPMLGRTFTADEEQQKVRVVVLSHGLWQRRFGASPNVVGRRSKLTA